MLCGLLVDDLENPATTPLIAAPTYGLLLRTVSEAQAIGPNRFLQSSFEGDASSGAQLKDSNIRLVCSRYAIVFRHRTTRT